MKKLTSEDVEIPEIEPGVYQHYKGKKYEVIGVGLETETLVPYVIYKPLYESEIPYWIRPLAMFEENVEVNGIEIPRFSKIS